MLSLEMCPHLKSWKFLERSFGFKFKQGVNLVPPGVCHQTDVPAAGDAVEREGTETGCAERTQRSPRGIHGH